MEILGLGLGEWFFVLVILFVVMGPREMVNLSRRIALGVQKIRRSELWRSIKETERELAQVPQELIKETGLKALEEERRSILADVRKINAGTAGAGWETGAGPHPSSLDDSGTQPEE